MTCTEELVVTHKPTLERLFATAYLGDGLAVALAHYLGCAAITSGQRDTAEQGNAHQILRIGRH